MEPRFDVSRPPIPEPFAPAGDEEAKFFIAFWPVFGFSLLLYAALMTFLLFPIAVRMSPLAKANVCLVCVAAAALAALLTRALGVVRVSASGIRGQDGWCRSRALSWDEPISLRPGWIFPFRYLVLRPQRGRKLWLPLFLSDMEGFKSAVHLHAPLGHPLRQALKLPQSPSW